MVVPPSTLPPSRDDAPNDAMADPAPVRFHGFNTYYLTLAVRRVVSLELSPWVGACARSFLKSSTSLLPLTSRTPGLPSRFTGPLTRDSRTSPFPPRL
jgi:hypothetical protein